MTVYTTCLTAHLAFWVEKGLGAFTGRNAEPGTNEMPSACFDQLR